VISITAKELCHLLNGELIGNPATKVTNFAKIEEANEGMLSFIANPKYEHFAATTNASVLLVSRAFNIPVKESITLIKVDEPYSALAFLLEMMQKMTEKEKTGIEANSFIAANSTHGENLYLAAFAYIGENCVIGKNVKIFPHVFIGDHCQIADNTVIHAGVKIYHHSIIGSHVVIHAGTVIGSDGFGFAPQKDGSYKKVPQTGHVIIEDHVEIGANTVIDRATLGATIIKKGAKLDNLIQIAHNVEIGENTVVAAQAGISGSTKLGKNVMVGGQAGFVGHIKIADGTKINAQSGVSKGTEKTGQSLTGSPAMDFREAYKMLAMMKRMPDFEKRLKALEDK
jgi:UDP-3-O-[3-hydroxymyristoyl] glucosamine N-acyltransferase